MFRVNVSIVDPDSVLKRAQDEIDSARLQLVSPGNEIENLLDILRNIPACDRPCRLDLIAHAWGGELHFATWRISATEQESTLLRNQIEEGTIGEVRLLGCRTAEDIAGRAAMQHLKRVLDIPVYGTTSYIDATDFGPCGFKSDLLLIEYDGLPREDRFQPRPHAPGEDIGWSDLKRIPAIESLVEQLRSETEDEARADSLAYDESGKWSVVFADKQLGTLCKLLAGQDPDLRVAPGLLLLPDAEVLFPAPSRNGSLCYFRVTSLLDGQILRVYPNGYPDGVLLRPTQPLVLPPPPPTPSKTQREPAQRAPI